MSWISNWFNKNNLAAAAQQTGPTGQAGSPTAASGNALAAAGQQITLTSPTPTTTTVTISGAGGGGGGGAGNNGGNGVGSIYWGSGGNIQVQTGNGTYTTVASWPPTPLTEEEKKELEELQRVHKEETKAVKLNEFKKLPAEMRQFVVNMIVWRKSSSSIHTVEATKSDRLKELESKLWPTLGAGGGSSGLYISGGNFWFNNNVSSVQIDIAAILGLPDGITTDDIEAAHLEATIEEQMLDEE